MICISNETLNWKFMIFIKNEKNILRVFRHWSKEKRIYWLYNDAWNKILTIIFICEYFVVVYNKNNLINSYKNYFDNILIML